MKRYENRYCLPSRFSEHDKPVLGFPTKKKIRPEQNQAACGRRGKADVADSEQGTRQMETRKAMGPAAGQTEPRYSEACARTQRRDRAEGHSSRSIVVADDHSDCPPNDSRCVPPRYGLEAVVSSAQSCSVNQHPAVYCRLLSPCYANQKNLLKNVYSFLTKRSIFVIQD